MPAHEPMSPAALADYTARYVRPADDVAAPGNDHIGRCLGAVARIADAISRDAASDAEQARRNLDELCWSPEGYPAPVVAALDAAGLRSAPR